MYLAIKYRGENTLIRIDKEKRKSIQINILKEVDKYCRINKLTYYLAYGTLIGAIRHRGYIPWDDDIDIVMPRPDYEKFIKYFNNTIDDIKVYSFEINSNFPFAYAKVANELTIEFESTNIDFEIGVNIDVFPIDGIKLNDESILNKQKLLRLILDIKKVKLSRKRKLHKNICIVLAKVLFCCFKKETIIKKMINTAKIYQYSDSDFVCLLCGALQNEPVSKSYFSQGIKVYFEGEMFNAPIGYDSWLRTLYGDYMLLPPIEMRKTHHDFESFFK